MQRLCSRISAPRGSLMFQSAAPPRSWPFLKVGQFWQTNLSGWRTSRKTKASKAASVGGLFHFQPSPSIGSRGRFMVNSNVLRLQLAPALDLGLVAVLGEA